jgi:hypothetical protein
MYARAVELVTERMRRIDLLTSPDVASAVRSTKAVVRREERKQQLERLVKAVVAHVDRNGTRLGVDAEMENFARSQRGRPHVPIEFLIVQLALQEVFERVPTDRLRIEDARNAARVAKLRIAVSFSARPDARDDRIHRRPVG